MFTLDAVFKKFKITDDKAIKAIEKLAKDKITPIVNKFCQECCNTMSSYDNKLNFKLEASCDKAIWLGKKKYVLRVHSSEGVTFAKPKFKVKGLELVKSSTPAFVRAKLKTALDIVFDSDEQATQAFIVKVKSEFMKLPYQQVAFPRGVNSLKDYTDSRKIYAKGTPIQVRGALLYNHYLKEYGIDGKYIGIGEGDKSKFVYLKMPNKLKENVVSFPADGSIPPEFGIENRIDYEEQFSKTFLASMDILLKPIGWKSEETSSLDAFF
jgi:DNA polymerase elongation subunit (family B)